MLARSWGLQFCPSVRLSVTRVLCDETVERTADILIPHERVIILVVHLGTEIVAAYTYFYIFL